VNFRQLIEDLQSVLWRLAHGVLVVVLLFVVIPLMAQLFVKGLPWWQELLL